MTKFYYVLSLLTPIDLGIYILLLFLQWLNEILAVLPFMSDGKQLLFSFLSLNMLIFE